MTLLDYLNNVLLCKVNLMMLLLSKFTALLKIKTLGHLQSYPPNPLKKDLVNFSDLQVLQKKKKSKQNKRQSKPKQISQDFSK